MVIAWLQITGYNAWRNLSLCVGTLLPPVCSLVTWEVIVKFQTIRTLSSSLLLTLEIVCSTLFNVTETKWHGPPSKVLSSYKERVLQKDGSCKESPNKLSHVSPLSTTDRTCSRIDVCQHIEGGTAHLSMVLKNMGCISVPSTECMEHTVFPCLRVWGTAQHTVWQHVPTCGVQCCVGYSPVQSRAGSD